MAYYDRTKDQISYALDFDGTNDSVVLAAQPNISTAVTVEAWVIDSTLDTGFHEIFNNNQIFVRRTSSGEGYYFETFVKVTGDILCNRARSTTVPIAGRLYHVAGTWDGSNVKIYGRKP